jgi:hypothetical protein
VPGLLQERLGPSFIELNCTSVIGKQKARSRFVQTTESALPLPASSRARHLGALLRCTITRNWKAAADASRGLCKRSPWHARGGNAGVSPEIPWYRLRSRQGRTFSADFCPMANAIPIRPAGKGLLCSIHEGYGGRVSLFHRDLRAFRQAARKRSQMASSASERASTVGLAVFIPFR